MMVAKLHAARQRMKKKTGVCEGRKPYGYCGGEQVIVDGMAALRARGVTYEAIGATLNSEGMKPQPGRVLAPWIRTSCADARLKPASKRPMVLAFHSSTKLQVK
jgi:hypothetical protein